MPTQELLFDFSDDKSLLEVGFDTKKVRVTLNLKALFIEHSDYLSTTLITF